MRLCLALAGQARAMGEIPVGAVVRRGRDIIACAHNETVLSCDPSAHAEVVALRRASISLGNHRLADCALYVSLEPCLMCAGAMIQARIAELVYGADDIRFGAFKGERTVFSCLEHNHRFPVRGGLMAEESSALLKDFFRERRG